MPKKEVLVKAVKGNFKGDFLPKVGKVCRLP